MEAALKSRQVPTARGRKVGGASHSAHQTLHLIRRAHLPQDAAMTSEPGTKHRRGRSQLNVLIAAP